ncbi:MAG: cation-translocating P-type ATPase [Lachnospiraceae bacterium]|nr:cation-translocating P-type ATPase [Lachnospiraceae bacterium]
MKKAIDKIEWLLELGGIKRDIVFLVLSGIALLLSFFKVTIFSIDFAWISIVLCGLPIILEAIIGLITEFDVKADVLVSLALIASICIGEDFAAGEVAFIMQIGGLLEEITAQKARAGIEKLVHLTPQTARILKDGKETIVAAEQVQIGDRIRVLAGETIPVDGVILSGETAINQAVLTGESMPVDKSKGDEVYSGTVNQFGVFEMEATKANENSSIQRMLRLVQSADADKAKIVGMADKWATWIVVIALTAASITWAVTGEIIRAVTILVVFCPCAFVLATPTAIMAAMGNATKHGFLVREGDALERLAKVSKITFDKTGTLTYGKPKVSKVYSIHAEYPEQLLYAYVAAAEQYSEHPLGKAITTNYKKQVKQELKKAEQFTMLPGQGVQAVVDKQEIIVGNTKLLKQYTGQDIDNLQKEAEQYVEKGCTIVYVAINQVISGFLALSDTIRKESADMIKRMNKVGVEPILLTGDNEKSANTIAAELKIGQVYAHCMPEDKLKHISDLQKSGYDVCMIGDGINDAPALKKANVGIAMGEIGSDIAMDAADIVLVDDEVKELPHLLQLSKRMMVTITCNLSFSMGLNLLAIVLAITGILNPVVGALVHNTGSVLVIINSALLLRWRKKDDI